MRAIPKSLAQQRYLFKLNKRESSSSQSIRQKFDEIERKWNQIESSQRKIKLQKKVVPRSTIKLFSPKHARNSHHAAGKSNDSSRLSAKSTASSKMNWSKGKLKVRLPSGFSKKIVRIGLNLKK